MQFSPPFSSITLGNHRNIRNCSITRISPHLLSSTPRTFERRFGTSRFFTYLLTSFLFSTCIEAAVTFALTYVAESVEFTGLLAVGPYVNRPAVSRALSDYTLGFCLSFSVIFCLFIPFFFDIPKLSSATFGGVSMSSKVLPYFAALHILSTSKANVIAGLSGIVS